MFEFFIGAVLVFSVLCLIGAVRVNSELQAQVLALQEALAVKKTKPAKFPLTK